MQFLYLLEKIRNPILDFLMSTITFVGGEAVFLAIAIVLIWCTEKRYGYLTLLTCFFGTILNQVLKLTFRIPRPWIKDPDFTIVESAREEATGYSFPSGHTQTAVGSYGAVARWHKQKWLRGLGIALCIFLLQHH